MGLGIHQKEGSGYVTAKILEAERSLVASMTGDLIELFKPSSSPPPPHPPPPPRPRPTDLEIAGQSNLEV